MSPPIILVTGGAGYVGSHTIIALLENGYEVLAIDNMINAVMGENGKPESLSRIEKLTSKTVKFMLVNLLDRNELDSLFQNHGPFECVIHFAALKAVGESCAKPLMYYKNNLTGSINLLEVMNKFNCKNIVFSSSATVYGNPQYLPLDENHPTGNCTNPYGKTKFMMEEMMKDLCTSDPKWKCLVLRYFNPVGAHSSGLIGEDPHGIPNNLMPFITQVAVGTREVLQIYGNDYDTKDGTGCRDYIHVMDLATGHVAAVKKLSDPQFVGWKPYNLGTGSGHTVLQVVHAFQSASGKNIPYKITTRRKGDIASSYADCTLAQKDLQWKATLTLHDMCVDSWNWQSKNPNGFKSNPL